MFGMAGAERNFEVHIHVYAYLYGNRYIITNVFLLTVCTCMSSLWHACLSCVCICHYGIGYLLVLYTQNLVKYFLAMNVMSVILTRNACLRTRYYSLDRWH